MKILLRPLVLLFAHSLALSIFISFSLILYRTQVPVSVKFTAASADSAHRNKFDFSRKITIFVHLIEKSEAKIFNDVVCWQQDGKDGTGVAC